MIYIPLFYHDEFTLSSNSLLLIKLERLLKEIFEEYLRSQNLSLSLENLRKEMNGIGHE